MGRLRYYLRDKATGRLRAECEILDAARTKAQILADLVNVLPADVDALDAATAPPPPTAAPLADPLKAKYAAAVLTNEKVDVLAERLGLK